MGFEPVHPAKSAELGSRGPSALSAGSFKNVNTDRRRTQKTPRKALDCNWFRKDVT
jgi:hypothetical protein